MDELIKTLDKLVAEHGDAAYDKFLKAFCKQYDISETDAEAQYLIKEVKKYYSEKRKEEGE